MGEKYDSVAMGSLVFVVFEYFGDYGESSVSCVQNVKTGGEDLDDDVLENEETRCSEVMTLGHPLILAKVGNFCVVPQANPNP